MNTTESYLSMFRKQFCWLILCFSECPYWSIIDVRHSEFCSKFKIVFSSRFYHYVFSLRLEIFNLSIIISFIQKFLILISTQNIVAKTMLLLFDVHLRLSRIYKCIPSYFADVFRFIVIDLIYDSGKIYCSLAIHKKTIRS